MVIYAHLNTNVKNIVQSPVDDVHRIRYGGSSVTVQDNGGRDHVLDTSTGELWLGDIQCPELSLVNVITRYGVFKGDRFDPRTAPSKGEFNRFPTIFELERLARDAVVINGIARLSSDGTCDFSPGDSYFREQKAELDTFVSAYGRAVDTSHFGKPVLEGFYLAMKERNTDFLKRAEDPDRPEAGRNAMRRLVYQEADFANAFGRELFGQLREVLEEPKFR